MRVDTRVTYPLPPKYLAAGLFLAILPAGEIWSVVTESGRLSNTWASLIPSILGSSLPCIIKFVFTWGTLYH
jgi:muramidase (phage lysozyme)